MAISKRLRLSRTASCTCPTGWGSVYAIDMTSGKKGTFRLEIRSRNQQGPGAGDVACCGVNNRGVAPLGRTRSFRSRSTARMFAPQQGNRLKKVWERQDRGNPRSPKTITLAPAGPFATIANRSGSGRRRIRHSWLDRRQPTSTTGQTGLAEPTTIPGRRRARPTKPGRTGKERLAPWAAASVWENRHL